MKTLFLTIIMMGFNSQALTHNSLMRINTTLNTLYPSVQKYTYKCTYSTTLKRSPEAGWTTEEQQTSGTEVEIVLDEQNSIITSVEKDQRTVSKVKTENIDNDTVKKTMISETLFTDRSETHKSTIITIAKTMNGLKTIISKEVDGKASPILWSHYEIKIDEKTTVFTTVHNQPSIRNSDETQYSRIVYSCLYTQE